MDQLSLVFFTVLAQVAVGIFIALGLFELLAKPDARTLNKSFIAVWGVLGIAALASMTHLAQPLRMFNVLIGVGHAGMARH
ncbi:DmsC/YnfH family molybdoenzyme membrane anchor subunit [Endozoicomonas lisbonensis]|uniref:DmsC/YnfH family molybdoenzyme membrane anchor subunit n=1 Tax=Endozoicomonas lisbonensis TaxID=3120522 RepID=UPI003392FB6E